MTAVEVERRNRDRKHPRGTTNGGKRGTTAQRRARKERMMADWRADVDVIATVWRHPMVPAWVVVTIHEEVPLGLGTPAVRCWRCGDLLTIDSLTVDKRVPDCEGGTYADDNIRPACLSCNSITGNMHRVAKNGR